MGLDDNQVKGHVSPGKLGKLKAIMPFLEGADEEDEALCSVSMEKAFFSLPQTVNMNPDLLHIA